MSFMMKIDAARAALYSPLDLLATEYLRHRPQNPSIAFCCRVAGVPDTDEVIARRLQVTTSTVRGWREIGRRAESLWAYR